MSMKRTIFVKNPQNSQSKESNYHNESPMSYQSNKAQQLTKSLHKKNQKLNKGDFRNDHSSKVLNAPKNHKK
jgi:hypothetical protein